MRHEESLPGWLVAILVQSIQSLGPAIRGISSTVKITLSRSENNRIRNSFVDKSEESIGMRDEICFSGSPHSIAWTRPSEGRQRGKNRPETRAGHIQRKRCRCNFNRGLACG